MDLSTEKISMYDPRTADASPRTAEYSDRSRGISGASPKANVQAIVNCIVAVSVSTGTRL
jgi:hypothetical protein